MTTLTATRYTQSSDDGSHPVMIIIKREHTCCFTGHREIPDNHAERLSREVEKQIMFLAGKGITTFLAGGARGFDSLAASAVLRIREVNPKLGLRLILVLPCPDQANRWSGIEKALYEEIKNQADGVITLFDKYTEGCMLERNKYMVDNSIVCVAYFTHKKRGGTYHTINYCKRQGVMTVIFS
jgi:uncharacterized phage-like protein YoqJ